MNNKFLNKTAFLLFLMLLIGAAQQGFAATRTVTKVADTEDGVCNADCSLREAVGAAQDGDEIKFAPSLAEGKITLQLGTIVIHNKNITINGISSLAISGNDKFTVFHVSSAKVRMINLDIGNAYKDNQPNPWTGAGGGLFVYNSMLELDNCYIHNNKAEGRGGAMMVLDSVLKIKNTLFAANRAFWGGAIGGYGNTIEISKTRFNLNQGLSNGGALSLGNSQLEMTDSSIYKSSSPGGKGGAMFLEGVNGSLYTIRNSAIHNNAAKTGGGIYSGTKLNLINTTISNNKATGGNGGGLSSSHLATLRNVTITLNSATGLGGGIESISGGDVDLGNTIVSGNSTANNSNADLKGGFTSSGYNVLGQTINASIFGTQTGNQTGVMNPMLNPLDYNGSTTLNHLPKPGSPVINAGSNALALDEFGGMLVIDQRGLDRVINGTVDVGAVEVQN